MYGTACTRAEVRLSIHGIACRHVQVSTSTCGDCLQLHSSQTQCVRRLLAHTPQSDSACMGIACRVCQTHWQSTACPGRRSLTAWSLTAPPCQSPGGATSPPFRRLSRCACCALTRSFLPSPASWQRLWGGALWSLNPLLLSLATMTPAAARPSFACCTLEGQLLL